MVKSLIDKLKKGISTGARRIVLPVIITSMLGFFTGCPIPPPEPPIPVPEPDKNNPPKATLYVEPTYGQAPLKTTLELDGEDPDGKEEIINYAVGEDKNDDDDIDDDNEMIKTDSYPINEEIIFSTAGTYKIIGQVTDSHGAIDKKSLWVIVSDPYDPTADLSLIPESEKNFDEESQTIINLPGAYDENPEDNPTWYTNATSLDGKVSVISLNENQLILTGNQDETGTYQVKLELENIKGETGEVLLTGEIHNLIDISGRLEDNETDSPQRGNGTVFDTSGISDYSSLTPQEWAEKIIGSAETEYGTFSLQTNKPCLKAILQAVMTDEEGNYTSYVGTVRLDGSQDYSGLVVKTVPFNGPREYDDGLIDNPHTPEIEGEVSAMDFREFMREINIRPYHGLVKFNAYNVEILKDDPLRRGSYFEEGEHTNIENKALEWSDIILRARGNALFIQKDSYNPEGDPGEDPDYHYDVNGDEIDPEMGWIIVVPNNEVGAGGRTYLYSSGLPCVIGKARIDLGSMMGYATTITSHEYLHCLGALGHAQTLGGDKTIMTGKDSSNPTTLESPGPADEKGIYIIHDEYYQPTEGLSYIKNIGLLNEGTGDGYNLLKYYNPE